MSFWRRVTSLAAFGLLRPSQCMATSLTGTIDLRARNVDAPSLSNFRWRAHMSIAVLGNCLYIEGGELAQFDDNAPANAASREKTSDVADYVNSTLSLPLDQPWTNETVQLRTITKAGPAQKEFALWPDPDGQKMYAWGGEAASPNNDVDLDELADPYLWAFTADTSGGTCSGTWDRAGRAPDNIWRAVGGTPATCAGRGLFLGGVASSTSDRRVAFGQEAVPLPGLLSYDMETREWSNRSRTVTSPYETSGRGRGVCMPFGPSGGLVMWIGGCFRAPPKYETVTPMPMTNLTFYDPVADKWYSKVTTGGVPTPRSNPCVVGVKHPKDGTYDIFVYGGYEFAGSTALDDVWVLTIPGFRWFLADVKGSLPRWAHSCALVGNRQMAVVGGLQNVVGSFALDASPPSDPWPQGLAVMDMSQLAWSDQYDPTASEYEHPTMVKEWYDNGGLDTVDWGRDDDIKALFLNEDSPLESPASKSDDAKSKTNAGPIAGGVVGGIMGVAIIVGAAFYMRRRRRLRGMGGDMNALSEAKDGDKDNYGWVWQRSELDAVHAELVPPQELGSSPPIRELEDLSLPRQELEDSPLPRQELDGNTRKELDATTQELDRHR